MTWAPQFYPTRKLIVHHTATSDNYTDRAGAEEYPGRSTTTRLPRTGVTSATTS